MKVAKFGGSSLADASQFKKVKDIIMSDRDRHYVVPSAPGKRSKGDDKVTDLLYLCYETNQQGKDCAPVFDRIKERYNEIIEVLELNCSLEADYNEILENIKNGASKDYAASRGEYMNGKLLAAYLGFDFIDAADVIHFDENGMLLEDETNELLHNALSGDRYAVIPGFYGSTPDGKVHTFSRGGSDVSGALVARGANADLYENWTDVNGFCMTDPRIVTDARFIDVITYKELRELSYMGASVLHEDAVFPVRKAGIPTNIRNTNDPLHPGTIIKNAAGIEKVDQVITGIAGRKGFAVISIEKDMMNAELGFGRRVLKAIEESGISFEHLPTGIDTMCVVVKQEDLDAHEETVINRINEVVHPDQITIHRNLALIATVGRGMVSAYGTAAKLFTAISSQGISIRIIDQGSSELNIIVGVNESDFENTVKAIYDAFVRA